VKNNYYGPNPLFPTGPGLLGNYFNNEDKSKLEMYHANSFVENKLNEYYIVYNNTIILSNFKGYRDEQSKFQKFKHYSQLWDDKNIYF
jgi:hypothetical protein